MPSHLLPTMPFCVSVSSSASPSVSILPAHGTPPSCYQYACLLYFWLAHGSTYASSFSALPAQKAANCQQAPAPVSPSFLHCGQWEIVFDEVGNQCSVSTHIFPPSSRPALKKPAYHHDTHAPPLPLHHLSFRLSRTAAISGPRAAHFFLRDILF